MPVSGPSSYLGREDRWAWDALYAGYTPPPSEDVAPAPYAPSPASPALGRELGNMREPWLQPFSEFHPTTTWADVSDRATRAQQRREQGSSTQPRVQDRAEPPVQPPDAQQQATQQQQAAQSDLKQQANAQRIAQGRQKVQQAQRDRQEREQAHGQAREAAAAAAAAVKQAEGAVQSAKSDINGIQSEISEAEGTEEGVPDGLDSELDNAQEALDAAQAALDQARAAHDSAVAAEQQAAEAVQQAVTSEETATRDLQQAESEQQQAEQQAQQTQQQAEQAPQPEAAPSPYGEGAPAPGEQLPDKAAALGDAATPWIPEAEPGQPGETGQPDPVQEAISKVRAAGGDANALLDDVATRAWQQQSGRAAPDWMNQDDVRQYDEYREAWKGAFRAGQDVPLANELRTAATQARSQPAGQQISQQSERPDSTLVGGLDRPPLAEGEHRAGRKQRRGQPGAGPARPVPGATMGAPGAGVPSANLAQAQQTLAAAQARDAEMKKLLEQANSAAEGYQQQLEEAQAQAKKISDEMSLGIGSTSYRQYSLGPAMNQAQAAVSGYSQQLSQARAKAAQAQQGLAASAQSIAAAQNLVKLASTQPGPGPATAVAGQASDTAQTGNLLGTFLGKAPPELQQRLAGDIAAGGPAGTEVLKQIASAAWFRQVAAQGQGVPASGPPRDYVESWLGMWRAGQDQAPLQQALRAELQRRGVVQAAAGPQPNMGPPLTTQPPRPGQTAGAPTSTAVLDQRDAGVQTPNGAPGGPAGSVLPAGGAPPDYVQVAGSIYVDPAHPERGQFQRQPDGTFAPVSGPILTPRTLSDPGGAAIEPIPNTSGTVTIPDKGPADTIMRDLAATVSYPTQLPTEQRRLWDEWRAAGGSGDWESFRQHALRVGAPDLGAEPRSVSDPRDRGVLTPSGAPPRQPRPPAPITSTTVESASNAPDLGPLLRPGEQPAPEAGAPSRLGVVSGLGGRDVDPLVVTAAVAGVRDEQGQATIANGINGYLRGDPNATWAKDHLENVARLGWWFETGQQEGTRAEDAPPEYIAKWVEDFKNGETTAPLQEQLNKSLHAHGLPAPMDAKNGRAPYIDWSRGTERRPAAPDSAPDEIEAYIRAAAQVRGINPDYAIAVAQSEGGLDPARRGTFDTGSSWWPFQLHYGGRGYEHLGTQAGMGNRFTASTGWQPGDPRAWKDSVDFALDEVGNVGWGQWYGARKIGITGMMGIQRR